MNWLERKKLFYVTNKAVAAARRKNDPITAEKIINRLWKAFGILQHHDYYQQEKELYCPTFDSCGCKDFEYRYARNRRYQGMCKHQMALILEARVNSLSYQQTTFLGLDAVQTPSMGFTGKVWVKELN